MQNHTLYLSLATNFTVDNDSISPSGLTFFQWLPNDIKDAVKVCADNNMTIAFYFKRMGIQENHGSFKYDVKTLSSVSDEYLEKQRLHLAGPLFIEIESKITEAELNKLKLEDKIASDELVIFLKETAIKLTPFLRKFSKILKTHYGQFWLPSLELYDDVNCPIHFFERYQTKWRLDSENKIKRLPNSPKEIVLEGTIYDNSTFQKYLHKEEWNKISELLKLDDSLTLTHEFFTRACEENSNHNFNYAVIIANTSFELLYQHIKNENLFRDLPKRKQFSCYLLEKLSLRGTMEENLLKELINERNAIVHDGIDRKIPITDLLENLAHIINLLNISPFKFNLLIKNPGNESEG